MPVNFVPKSRYDDYSSQQNRGLTGDTDTAQRLTLQIDMFRSLWPQLLACRELPQKMTALRHGAK
jgi:hypothetical protein